jgi:predicted MPP superfamily phosphohydrolase
MGWFLFTFLSVYSGMNALVYYKARILLPQRWSVHASLVFFLILMLIAPIGIRLLERSGYEGPARLLAYIGYNWMGFVFLSLWGFLAVGIIGLVFRLVNVLARAGLPPLTGKGSTAAVFAAVLVICVYGYIEAHSIRVERRVIKTERLPPGVDRLKIAQVSDVHLGLLNGKERLQKIVDLIRAEQPDLLAATGDVVDGDMAKNGAIHELWQQIRPPLGKYAVTGNHEYYAGLTQALEAIDRSGFRILRGEAVTAEKVLNIVGVDDPTGGVPIDEAELLASWRNGLFTLFLKHRPQVSDKSRGLFDLQLSGHTHLGQIFPFRFLTGMVYPMQNGLYDLGGGSFLYASRGTGTWGPPIRVLSPPEIGIIELAR